MGLFNKNKQTDELIKPADDVILALDIGTEYVKTIIAREKHGELEIIGVGKAHQSSGNMFDGAIADIPGVVSVCEKALTRAENMAGVTCRNAVVGIAGELVKGNTSTIRYRRKNGNKPLSEQEMALIIDRVQEKAGAEARSEVALETNNPDVEIRLINSAIVGLHIDGYKISNPIGFKGTDVQVQLYTAFAPLVHISAIEKVCAELNLDLVAVAVEPFAVCRACLGDDVENDFSGIVMDIGGGTTDLAVVDDGGVEGTKMFSIGGRSFTHQISQALGVDFATAEKYKLMLDDADRDEKIDAKILAKIEKGIKRNLAVWLSGIQLTLEDFNLTEMLPSSILLCGGGAGLLDLQEALATTNWYNDLPFSRRPVVRLVSASEIPDIKNSTDAELDHSYITALGLLRVALDTAAGEQDDNSLRGRIERLLQN